MALLFFRMNMYLSICCSAPSNTVFNSYPVNYLSDTWHIQKTFQANIEEFNITTGLRINNNCDWITSSLSHNTSHLFYLFDPDFHAGLYLFCGLCAVCCCHVVWWAFQHPQVKCVTLFKGNLEASQNMVYFCCCVKYLLCLWTCLFTQGEAVVKTGCWPSF